MKLTVSSLLVATLTYAFVLTGCSDTSEKVERSTPNVQPKTIAPLKAEELKGEIKIMVPGGLNHTTFLEVLKGRFIEKHPGIKVNLELIPEIGKLAERSRPVTHRIY